MRGKLLRDSSRSVAYGTLLNLPEPAFVEILGSVGYDFAIVDMEHGSLDFRGLEHMVRAGEAIGIKVIVRVGEVAESAILRALESGVAGIVAPRIRTADDARMFVAFCRYPPIGLRGSCRVTRATRYSNVPFDVHVEASNAGVWTAAIIEEIEAVEQFDLITTVEGLDAVWPGPVDLAASLGYPGQLDAPPVLDALNTVMRKAARNPSLDVGVYVTSPADAGDWVRKGANVLIYSMDGRVISDAYREALAHLQRAVASVA